MDMNIPPIAGQYGSPGLKTRALCMLNNQTTPNTPLASDPILHRSLQRPGIWNTYILVPRINYMKLYIRYSIRDDKHYFKAKKGMGLLLILDQG